MSRAFVKETERDETVDVPEPELPPGVPNRITPAGARRLRDELARLQAEKAALRGVEGAEAEARRRTLDRRVPWLERRVVTFVETPTPEDVDRVVFGAVVTVSGDQGERTWQIVGVDETDPSAGRISFLAPIAKALLGRREGDEVTVRLPAGEESWEIVRIAGTSSDV